MKPIIISILSLALPMAVLMAQCPVTAPTANTSVVDGGAPNCDPGTYKYVGQVSSSALGSCFGFSGSSCGIVYYGSTYSLNCGFCVNFNFTLSTLTSDGVAFTMADFSQTPSGNPCSSPLDACAAGGNIGYNTFNNAPSNLNGGGALTIEFDPFDNTSQGDADLPCDHIAIVEDGNNDNFISRACSPVNLDNGAQHSASICWDPFSNQLIVRVDGIVVLTLNQNIRSYFTGTNVHFAFSSGYNPSFVGSNQVCNWTVVPFGPLDASDVLSLSGIARNEGIYLESSKLGIADARYQFFHSTDGAQFELLSELTSDGDKALLQYLDRRPASGGNYYKVVALDNAGNAHHSNVVYMETHLDRPFSISQHPSSIELRSVDPQSSFSVYLMDVQGRILASKQGNGSLAFDTDNISDGLILVRAESASGHIIEKIRLTK